MGQNFSSRRSSENQLRFQGNAAGEYGNTFPPANAVYQTPYQQPARGHANRSQQYLTYPTQYPDVYPYGNYGSAPRQQMPQQAMVGNAAQQTELQQTKTIRNQVNLKKQTLRIAFCNKERTVIMPRFTFDASAPCSVTMFFLAKEDSAKGCRLSSLKSPGPRTFYEKGLAQVFPPQDDAAAAQSYTLDLTQCNDVELTKVTVGKDGKDETFPVVIRLETITEKGIQAGHSLEELQAGSPIPAWVQSQTTYAYLVKEEDGTWEARTVKQKIWVEGISYELQEIYGIQDIYSRDKKGAASNEKPKDSMASMASEDLEGRECVICLSAVRDTTVLPCRHMCMCEACARELQRQQVSRCPICRDVIESLLHIKRPDKRSDKSAEKVEGDQAARIEGDQPEQTVEASG